MLDGERTRMTDAVGDSGMSGDVALESFFDESKRLLVPHITSLTDCVRTIRSDVLLGDKLVTAHSTDTD